MEIIRIRRPELCYYLLIEGMQLQCTGEKTLRDPGHRNGLHAAVQRNGLHAASGEENVRCRDE